MVKSLIRTGKVFASACCVYYAMAACSGGGGGEATSGGPSSGAGGNLGSGGADNASGGSSGNGTSGGTSGTASSSSGASGSPVPNAMADEWYKPGTRLKLQYFEGSDGTKQFTGWLDSVRNESCGFFQHADGATRCMPIIGSLGTGSLYADAGCVVPLAFRVKSPMPAPSAALSYDAAAAGYHVFSVIAPYTGTLHSGTPATCTAFTASTAATYYNAYDIYALSAEVPGSTFVSATKKTSP